VNHQTPIRQLATSALALQPSARWNAFIDLIATEDYEDLGDEQRIAHLAFWYDSEVQNEAIFSTSRTLLANGREKPLPLCVLSTPRNSR
jgi:hypothetical protein